MQNLLFLGGLGGFEIIFIILLPIVLWIWALVDCLKSNFESTNKLIWVVVIILLPVLGPILYFLVGRSQRL